MPKIGVFDSGLGGLAILREFLKALPQFDYIYFGDNANVPYGSKSPEAIYNLTQKAIDFLFEKDCSIVILACNTATAIALRKLQQEYLPKKYPDRRILGVIRPTVETVVEGKFKRVGVMGTYATIISKKFIRELRKFDKTIQVYQQACPLLVPIIEEGEIHWDGLDSILKKYLTPLKKEKIDSLILGCTHYGLIDRKIETMVGKKIKIISEGKVTAEKLKNYLQRHPEVKKRLSQGVTRECYFTDCSIRYKKLAKLFLGKYFFSQFIFFPVEVGQ